jgi:hypothetical protein
MLHAKKILLASLVAVAMGAILWGQAESEPASGQTMTDAAQSFLGTLGESQRSQATFAYDSPERLNWHFIPRERKGLPLKAIQGQSRTAAQRLIASGLSQAGYEQALNIMSLEEILYLLEGGDRAARRERRDPENYYLSIFGTPDVKGTWGWRVEGHHLSLNYTVVDGAVAASTPEFFGANPGLVNAGPGRAIRVLGAEEDLARQILKLCTPDQARVAWIDRAAPDDLRGANQPQPDTTAPVGLAYSDMSADQRKLLEALLDEYLRNMPADVARERRQALIDAKLDGIHFAWWGDSEPNQRHYYRVQGPTFLIEYNNTQNEANHVHSVWRNMQGDFNQPLEG